MIILAAAALLAGACIYVLAAHYLDVATGGPRPGAARWRLWCERQRTWLAQTGSSLTPLHYNTFCAACGVLTYVILTLVLGVLWSVAIPPALFALLLPRLFVTQTRARRVTELRDAWPDALLSLIVSMKTGMQPRDAIIELVHKGSDVIRDAFSRFEALDFTHGTIAALEEIKARLADPTSDRVLEILILATRAPGPALDILNDLFDALTEDIETDRAIAAAQLEPKIEAWAVTIMPWLLLIFWVWSNPAAKAYYQTTQGWYVLAAAAVLTLLGRAAITHWIQPHVEERVLTGERGR